MSKLDGRVAIITGAGQGIGRGIAMAFAKEGAKVIIAEKNTDSGKSVEKEVSELGAEALAFVCDVADNEQVVNMVDQAVKHFGHIDVLVNNAQLVNDMSPVESITEEAWDRVFNTGVKATWRCCKTVFPHMKDRGGKIINLASPGGLIGVEGMAEYNANKEAIRGLSRTIAREWGKYGINVNVIAPQAQTPLSMGFLEKFGAALTQSTAPKAIIARFGDPEKDIGRVAVFIASEDADFMTGHTFTVDGGHYLL